MSDYTPITDFSAKDALASGDPEKIATGADVDAELAAIQTAIASKANSASPTFTGNVVLPTTTTIGSNPVTAFPSGTAMIFAQTSAPTGWTKSITHNDKALRVVSGAASSGGATAFTSVFGSGKSTGSYTLQTADIPSHTHSIARGGGAGDGPPYNTYYALNADQTTGATGATGGGGGHSHTLSLDLQYVDVIIATKD